MKRPSRMGLSALRSAITSSASAAAPINRQISVGLAVQPAF